MQDPLQRLMEIDARHNDLLTRLESLDREVVAVLEQWTTARPALTVSGDPSDSWLRDTTVTTPDDSAPLDSATTLIVEKLLEKEHKEQQQQRLKRRAA